jgi:hypothetical protein
MLNINKKIQKIILNYIYINKKSSINTIISAISQLRPIVSPFELIRIGGENDGAYLIPNDLSEIKLCFSPGVGGSNAFEIDLFEKYAISSVTADASVEGLPIKHKGVSFLKKFIGSVKSSEYISFEEWIDSTCGLSMDDLLLQIDIEGGEYDVLINIDSKILSRFRVIAIEYHNLELLIDRYSVEIISSIFRKINKYFYPIYLHPNNVTGEFTIDGIVIPKTLEVVYLRKDRFKEKPIYHSIDSHMKIEFIKNDPKKDEIKLSSHWFGKII